MGYLNNFLKETNIFSIQEHYLIDELTLKKNDIISPTGMFHP